MADSSRHSLFMVPETTYGETPATPNLQELRHTGTTLALAKTTSVSEELRRDRQISDSTHGVRQVGGEIAAEFSFETYDSFLEAALMGTWAADSPSVGQSRLKAGVTRRSYSLLRYFEDIAVSDNPFHRFTGVEINNLSLQLSPDVRATTNFTVVGRNMETPQQAYPTGSVILPPTTSKVFNGFGGAILEGGNPIAVATELQLTLENGIEPRFVIGSDKTILPQVGRSNLSGQVVAYFEDSELLNKFIDEVESSLEFTITDRDGNSYVITLPRIKYNGGQPDTQGQGSITLTMPFQALYDATEGTNIIIDKVPA